MKPETKTIHCTITGNDYELYKIRQSNGNKWWSLIDIGNLPIKRAQIMLSRTNYAQMGLDTAFVKTCMKQINEYATSGNIGAVKILTEAFENRCDLGYNSKMILECAIVGLCLNDENLLTYSQNQDKKKWEVLMDNQDDYDFFLSWAFKLSTESYIKFHNSEESQEVLKAKEAILQRHLNKSIEQQK
jgi:hypothetical protein